MRAPSLGLECLQLTYQCPRVKNVNVFLSKNKREEGVCFFSEGRCGKLKMLLLVLCPACKAEEYELLPCGCCSKCQEFGSHTPSSLVCHLTLRLHTPALGSCLITYSLGVSCSYPSSQGFPVVMSGNHSLCFTWSPVSTASDCGPIALP